MTISKDLAAHDSRSAPCTRHATIKESLIPSVVFRNHVRSDLRLSILRAEGARVAGRGDRFLNLE